MSNYTISVNWSGKDALSDSDPAKVISGSDFNTEFSAVQTAVNTKAEVNGLATEAFSATTATAGTNTAQVASTAFVQTEITGHATKIDIMKAVYPLGSIFTTVSDATALATTAAEVATLMGFGTWVAFGAGKVPVGIDATDTDFDLANSSVGTNGVGGRKDAVLPSHTHDNVAKPHPTDTGRDGSAGAAVTGLDEFDKLGATTGAAGVVLTGNENLQPYIVVYMWKRTA